MPCIIASGRETSCKDAVGGIKGVYIHNYTEWFLNATSVVTDGVVTAIEDKVLDGGALTPFNLYYFQVRREMCSLEVSVNSSPENGTTFFEQRLTINVNKLSQDDANKMKLLAYGRPQIVVEDNQGNLIMLGAKNGMDVTSGSISAGQSFGDRNGVTLEFTGREDEAFYTMVGSDGTGTSNAPFTTFADTEITIGVTPDPVFVES